MKGNYTALVILISKHLLASLDPETMRDKITTFPGEIYNASKISKTAEAITLKAAEAGFAFARVRPDVPS